MSLIKKLTTENKIIEVLRENGLEGMKFSENKGLAKISDSKNNHIVFNCLITEYGSCCGMREIGGINCTYSVHIPENLRIDFVIKHLKKMMEEQVNAITSDSDSDDNETLGFSVTIPYDQGHYEIFLKAIEKIGFKEVAEFKNKNSGNRLKHFIYVW